MSGQVRLKDGVLDEELPTLLESVLKCLSKNLKLWYHGNSATQTELREDIVLPNEICDRYVNNKWLVIRLSICV